MTQYTRDIDSYITKRALELVGQYSESGIAEIISEEVGIEVSRSVIHGRIYRRRDVVELVTEPTPSMPFFDKYKQYYKHNVAGEPKLNYDFSRGPVKILVLNDMHIPCQFDEAVEQAVAENRSADVVVVSEPSDMYALSSFSKTKHISFEEEVEGIVRIYEFLSENFPSVVVVNSGHSKRLPKYILNRIHSELLFLVETDLLGFLAKPFGNIVTVPEIFYSINDALFSHIEKHSSVVPLRSAAKSHEWLQSWKYHLGIPDYRVLVQGHSHHSGIINLPDVQLIESGCLQKIPSWIFNKSPMLAWTHGWVVLYQYDGVTDRNSTQLVVYEGK